MVIGAYSETVAEKEWAQVPKGRVEALEDQHVVFDGGDIEEPPLKDANDEIVEPVADRGHRKEINRGE